MKILQVTLKKKGDIKIKSDLKDVEVQKVRHALVDTAVKTGLEVRKLGPNVSEGIYLFVYFLLLVLSALRRTPEGNLDLRENLRKLKDMYPEIKP